MIAFALLVSVLQAPLWVYYRRMDFVRQRALQAVDPVVGFVVSIGLAIAGAGYWAFVGGLAAGACAASLVAAAQSPFALRLRYEPGTLAGYWSFSAPLLISGAAGFVMAWSAVLTAKLHLGVAAVGVITLAATISSFTDRVDQLVTGALYPAICAVRDRTDVLYESLVKSNRLALMWAVPFGIGVSLFGSDLVRFVLGERWHPVVVLLEVYGVTAAVNHVGFNWTAYFRAVGRTRPIASETVGRHRRLSRRRDPAAAHRRPAGVRGGHRRPGGGRARCSARTGSASCFPGFASCATPPVPSCPPSPPPPSCSRPRAGAERPDGRRWRLANSSSMRW